MTGKTGLLPLRAWLPVGWLLVQAFAVPPARAQAHSQEVGASPGDQEEEDEIVVSGHPRRGSIRTHVPAETVIPGTAVRALGVLDVEEVLQAYAPQIRGADLSSPPALLVNGRRISNIDEIADYPADAISRVEIFPEALAAAQGFRPGQRVVNIVLRRKFDRGAGTARPTLLGPGAGKAFDVNFTGVHIRENERQNAATQYSHRLGRPAVSDDGFQADSLVGHRPASDRFKLNVGSVESHAGVAFEQSFSLHTREDRYLLALAALDKPGAMRRDSDFSGNLRVSADRARWSLSSAAVLRRSVTSRSYGPQIASDQLHVPLNALQNGCPSNALGCSSAGIVGVQLQTSAIRRTKSVADPSGAAVLTLSSDSLHARGVGSSHKSRQFGELRVSAALPICQAHCLSSPLTLGANLSIKHWSDYGNFADVGAQADFGGAGDPNLSVQISREHEAPSLLLLHMLPLNTPGFVTYDLSRGTAVATTIAEGGDPALRLQRRDALILRGQVPVATGATASIEYDAKRVADPLIEFDPFGPLSLSSLPGRTPRDAQGSLVLLDARPASERFRHTDQLKFAMNYSGSLAAAFGRETKSPDPAKVQVAFYHTWLLRDRLGTRGGGELDLLHSFLGSTEQEPIAHDSELQVQVYTRVFSIRAAGHRRAGKHIGLAPSVAAMSATFGLDLRLSADLARIHWLTRSVPWARGRLTLSLDNVIRRRPEFTGLNGTAAPLRFGSPDSARQLRISLRKVFW